MARHTGLNSTTPNTIQWADSDADVFERSTDVAGVAENLDLHDHRTGKGLGVGRLDTAAAPTAAGEVQVTGDTLRWWGATAGAIRTSVSLEGTETLSGPKTLSMANAHAAIVINASTGTNAATLRVTNTGGNGYVGLDSSTAGVLGGSNYGLTLFAPASSAVELIPGATAGNRLSVGTTGQVTVAAGVATPAGGSTALRLVFGTTAGFGVYVGSGAPTVSAAQGSLYLRSDGSSTSTRAYVNTNGSTTWTAITTVA